MGDSIEKLMEKYASNEFFDLLQFRKYVRGLPKEYRQNLEITKLESAINEIDKTILNMGRGTLSVSEIAKGTYKEQIDSAVLNQVLDSIGEKEMAKQVDFINDRK